MLALKSGLVFFLALATTLLGLQAAHATPTDQGMRSLGLVVTFDSTGTAFHIGKGCWLTAAHVVGDARASRLVTFTGASVPAFVAARDRVDDVALLRASDQAPFLKLSSRTPAPAERVWIVGFPGESKSSGHPVPLMGTVHPNTGQNGRLWISAVAFHGHSGSPVLDEDNLVVGMLVAAHRAQFDISLAVRGDVVRHFAQRC